MSTKTKFTNLNKSYQNLRVTKKLVINPQDTLIALKRSLKLIKDTSRKGGTILLVGNNTKYKQIMQTYALDVQQPFIYRNWVNGILSNETLLKNHLVTYGFKIDRSPMSDWLRRNKVSDFLMKYEGYLNCLKQPNLVIFLNTSRLSDALDEVNSLNIPSIGLSTTSMDTSKLTYPIPSNDQSLKTLTLFVELVIQSIKEGGRQREILLKHMVQQENEEAAKKAAEKAIKDAAIKEANERFKAKERAIREAKNQAKNRAKKQFKKRANKGSNKGFNKGPNRGPNKSFNKGPNKGPNKGFNKGSNKGPNKGFNKGSYKGPNKGANKR
jgi:small subunit ribosomal protein S2